MALMLRVSLQGSEPSQPEDYMSTSLGVIFPDDVTNQHGDAEHSLVYVSPHLPKPLYLDLPDPVGEADRRLFSHYLWNASLLVAELVERDTLGVADDNSDDSGHGHGHGHGHGLGRGVSFDVRDKFILELGAGTALPSIMAGLLGAARVVVTDYPAPAVIKTLQRNVARNIQPGLSPTNSQTTPGSSITVSGHSWGELGSMKNTFCEANRHSFDRVIVADCLWMPWQHDNLHKSIDHFLKETPDARCWVAAGFHTGRENMKGFFAEEALARYSLAVDRMWERDCDGRHREWSWNREEDVTERKSWLVVCQLRRTDKLRSRYDGCL